MPFYTNGDVRIRYEETGSSFPILLTPGGGLSSLASNWPGQVFNAMEEFKNDFRCITMDQRNAIGGESTGPVQVNDPWGAFADDQLGRMDHLGIQEFFFMGYCIGGPFALKLIERAPERNTATPARWPPNPKRTEPCHDSTISGPRYQAPARRNEGSVSWIVPAVEYRQPIRDTDDETSQSARKPSWSMAEYSIPSTADWNWWKVPTLRRVSGERRWNYSARFTGALPVITR